MATLNARPRTRSGKSGARQLRREGLVPAIMYGHGDTTRPLAVDAHELVRLLGVINAESTIIDVTVEGEAPAQALIREVQYHPMRPEVLHVDFFHVRAGEKITVDVPIVLHGAPVGVRDFGGVLDQVLYSLHVECLPSDIPAAVEVNVEALGTGESLHVRDLEVSGARVLVDGDVVVATVTQPTGAALPETAETEAGVGGEVEPELIRGHREDAEDVPFEHGSRQPE